MPRPTYRIHHPGIIRGHGTPLLCNLEGKVVYHIPQPRSSTRSTHVPGDCGADHHNSEKSTPGSLLF